MQQQQRAAVTDASLADIADLENRSTGEEADSVGGLPVLPSDQVGFTSMELAASRRSLQHSGAIRSHAPP
jgi:hypothetical protein